MAGLNDHFPFAGERSEDTIAIMAIEHLFKPFHSRTRVESLLLRMRIEQSFKYCLHSMIRNCWREKCRSQLPRTRFEKWKWDGNHLHYFTVQDALRTVYKIEIMVEEMLKSATSSPESGSGKACFGMKPAAASLVNKGLVGRHMANEMPVTRDHVGC